MPVPPGRRGAGAAEGERQAGGAQQVERVTAGGEGAAFVPVAAVGTGPSPTPKRSRKRAARCIAATTRVGVTEQRPAGTAARARTGGRHRVPTIDLSGRTPGRAGRGSRRSPAAAQRRAAGRSGNARASTTRPTAPPIRWLLRIVPTVRQPRAAAGAAVGEVGVHAPAHLRGRGGRASRTDLQPVPWRGARPRGSTPSARPARAGCGAASCRWALRVAAQAGRGSGPLSARPARRGGGGGRAPTPTLMSAPGAASRTSICHHGPSASARRGEGVGAACQPGPSPTSSARP